MTLGRFLPPLETALKLEPEDLAIPLLKYLIVQQESGDGLNLQRFMLGTDLQQYAGKNRDRVAKALTEAWIWLEKELMLAPIPGAERQWLYVTKRGRELAAQGDIRKYKHSNLIPPSTLDPILASKVLPLFIRGDYDTAVFQAFKLVEIRVRTASSSPNELLGVKLMREAFHPDNGKLTDLERPKDEREATGHLFAGAIGLFKNPASHRDVNWEDPVECAELIYLANHLLRIVRRRGDNK